MDILIFFKNKAFLSIFWLEIWWDVIGHPLTPVLQIWWKYVGVDWQKSGLNCKENPESMVFAPLHPPPNKISTFFIITAKVRSLPTFLCRKFIPTFLVWALWLFEWTHLVFLTYAKTRFAHKTTPQWRHRCAQPTSKDAVAVSQIRWCFHWLSSSICSEVMTERLS